MCACQAYTYMLTNKEYIRSFDKPFEKSVSNQSKNVYACRERRSQYIYPLTKIIYERLRTLQQLAFYSVLKTSIYITCSVQCTQNHGISSCLASAYLLRLQSIQLARYSVRKATVYLSIQLHRAYYDSSLSRLPVTVYVRPQSI